MDKYKLIKVTEGFLITCTEPITFSDTLKSCYYLFKGEVYKREYSHHTDSQKIIASNFIPELPSIDFNNLEEEFGIIDVEKLADEIIPKLQHSKYVKIGFIGGFNKSQELNKDKLYTLEDIKTAIRYGCNQIHLEKDKINNFIRSLQPKTEFEVELEMEQVNNKPGSSYSEITIYKPKITNNSIKIIRNA